MLHSYNHHYIMIISDKDQCNILLNKYYGVDEDNLNPIGKKGDTKLSLAG